MCALRLVGAAPTVALPAIGHELRSHRLLDESKCLPIKPSLLLAVCNVVSASEKNTGNVAEGHWISTRTPMTKHWLHPYLVVMRPRTVLRRNIRINHYESVLRRLRCCPAIVLMREIPFMAAAIAQDHPRESLPFVTYFPSPCCARHAFTASSLMSLG